MKHTLLLCFIHGFKGDEKTFGTNYTFTEHLRALVARDLPKIEVKVLVYPTYDTRGDLNECVNRFRDWLMEKVIDLEVESGTPSPTIDPSVRTIIIGHSMGGIVAAETAIALTSERPIHGSTDADKEERKRPEEDATTAPSERPGTPNGLMFPYVQGVLAFDTPYLGISPGVVAHGAEGHYAAASQVVAQLGGLAGLFSAGGNQNANRSSRDVKSAGALPPAAAASPASGTSSRSGSHSRPTPAAATPPDRKEENSSPWARWGKVAMYAGAVGAVAAAGAAAYSNKDQITTGWGWVSSHLEFVGCLARKEELRRRVAYMNRLNQDLGVGFGNLYTRLGKAAKTKEVGMVGTVLGKERTFCVVPKREPGGVWKEAINDAADSEIGAHMAMFEPTENPGYQKLCVDAAQMIKGWVNNDWYEQSSKDQLGA